MDGAVRTVLHDDVAVVQVAGELDVHSAGPLREELVLLLEAGLHDLLVDLTRVTFIDSTGLGVLVAGLKRVRGASGRMELAVDDPRVLKVLRITGLSRAFTLHRTVDDALARN